MQVTEKNRCFFDESNFASHGNDSGVFSMNQICRVMVLIQEMSLLAMVALLRQTK